MSNEPAVTMGAILGVLAAGLGLLAGFGLDITQEQAGLITGFASAVLAIIFAVITRSKVTPVGPQPPSHPE